MQPSFALVPMDDSERVDAVVIGAGLGGLAAAATLCKAGLSISVLEQHYVPGGYCHSFKRGKYIFDAAVEYIGSCGPNQDGHRLLSVLSIADRLKFIEMDPTGFDVLVYPKFSSSICKGANNHRNRLLKDYPNEHESINRYFDLIDNIWREIHSANIPNYVMEEGGFPSDCSELRYWSKRTLDDLFVHVGASVRLRAILAGQWGDYGVPPKLASVLVHVTTVYHYYDGAYYPSGGVQVIPDALVEVIKEHQGTIKYRCRVLRVKLLTNGKKRVFFDGGHIDSDLVIVNADIHQLPNLLPEDLINSSIQERIEKSEPSLASFQVYLGTKADLRAAGMSSANYWVTADENIDNIYKALLNVPPMENQEIPFLITSPSLKDPGGRLCERNRSIVKIVALVPFKYFEQWAQSSLGRRDVRYRELKTHIAKQLIRQAEKIIPGLGEHIELQEIGTPLTNISYTLSHQGAIYGFARTPQQFAQSDLVPQLGNKGIFFAGANTFYHGVMGSMLSGYSAALNAMVKV